MTSSSARFATLSMLVVLLPSLLSSTQHGCAEAATVRGAYYYFDSFYPINSIDGSLFTHIYYAFAKISPSTYTVVPEDSDGGRIATFSAAVKSNYPSIRTLLSIGGGGNPSPSPNFEIMAATHAGRQAFISSTIQLARNNGFDGLDLDWEYPTTEEHMTNFGALLTEWRALLQQEAQSSGKPRLLLTAAVYYSVDIPTWPGQITYPAATINTAMDWVNVMAYDFHGTWEQVTGAHTALYDPASPFNGDNGMRAWLASGVAASKLVFGMTTYGYAWFLNDPNSNGIGAPASEEGPNGGVYVYDQIKTFVSSSRAVCVNDGNTRTAYCYGKDPSSGRVVWVGYDNQNAIATKGSYVKSHGLAGYFFWKLGDDRNFDLAKQAYVMTSSQLSLEESMKMK